ncbi:high mobility group protein, putative [Anopheles sinensis]|uniref:High mobility group protein, putative n=1 Tax=Anopheles sinensis TaxID=74873 RepID=A0A084WJT8_ANOSI|nr:high mobility group protein, putative [Anopheles sinensis]
MFQMNQPAGICAQSEDTTSKDEDNQQVSQQQNMVQQHEVQYQIQEAQDISHVETNKSSTLDESLEDSIEEEMQLIQCTRSGCTNQAIESIDWDGEYCSNQCAVTHCRNIFGTFFDGDDGEVVFNRKCTYTSHLYEGKLEKKETPEQQKQ